MGWILRCETGLSEVPVSFSDEKPTSSQAKSDEYGMDLAQSESRMREIRTSGSVSGEAKRGDAERPKLPRPSSTLLRAQCAVCPSATPLDSPIELP